MSMRFSQTSVVLACAAALCGCGGGGGNSGGGNPPPAQTYSLGGTVSGLSSAGLSLSDGGAEVSIASGATNFQLATGLTTGTHYAVTIGTQPAGELCSVSNGSGTISAASVGNIDVACSVQSYALGGQISGLTASGLQLANGSDVLTLTANATSFTMSNPVPFGGSYNIVVQAQPAGLQCSVGSGSGTMPAAAVANVSVSCVSSNATTMLSGSVSGLASAPGLMLTDGIDAVMVAPAAGSYAMPTLLAAGSPYAVSIVSNPVGRLCSVANGTGIVGTANITNANVTCQANSNPVTGVVTGLVGTGLVLGLNGTERLPIKGNGPFAFASQLPSGTAATVTVLNQPKGPVTCSSITTGSAVRVTCLPVPTAPATLAISSFTPTSGPPGTMVMVTGTGFLNNLLSNITTAKVGSASDANFIILSNTNAVLTVPADASASAQPVNLEFDNSKYSGVAKGFTVTAGHATASATPMMLISRNLPAFADNVAPFSSPAAAVDGDYNTFWLAASLPAAFYVDLSSVPQALRNNIDLVWYTDGNYGYDALYPPYGGPKTYDNPGSYTIEANASPGGTATPPQKNWVVLATVTNNGFDSREHVLNFSGYNWIRMNVTASSANAATGNTTVALNMDIYSAPGGVSDGWFFGGDSITALSMRHDNPQGATSDSFGNLVSLFTGLSPPVQENGGMPYLTALEMGPIFPGYLKNFPGRYVTINLGSNDALSATGISNYSANMQVLIQQVLAAGKIPVLPTLLWSCDPLQGPAAAPINQQIRALYAANPQLVPGPDLYAFFADPHNQTYISSNDCTHPNGPGQEMYRYLWATWAANNVYGQ